MWVERLPKEERVIVLSILDSLLKIILLGIESKSPEQRSEEAAEWYETVKRMKNAPDPIAALKALIASLTDGVK